MKWLATVPELRSPSTAPRYRLARCGSRREPAQKRAAAGDRGSELGFDQSRGASEVDRADCVRLRRELVQDPRLNGAAPLRLGVRDLGVEHHHRIARDEALRETPLELERQLRAQLELGVA